jgi:hypothetical protein
MKKFLTLTYLTLFFAIVNLLAQRPSNEFSIYGGGGFSTLLFSPSLKGASSKGFGGDAGIGFTTFFNPQIGIHFGAGFGFNNVEVSVDNLKTVTPGLVDANDYLFDKHTTLSDYNESKKLTFVSIPIMLQFQQNLGTTHAFYAMGGTKISFQHQTEYKSSVATLSNAAYYPELNNWSATQTFANLGTFNGNSTDGNFKIELFVKLALEIGMKWRIGNNTFLYTGAYLDYGLNDYAKNQRKPLGEYITPQQLTDLTLLSFTDKINLTTAGIKLRLAFSRSSTPKQSRQQRMVPCP